MTSDLLERVHEAVDPRIDARRRAVREERRRRRRRIAIAVALVVGLVAGGWGLSRSALADVDHLEVTGTVNLRAEEVLAAAGVATGDPLVDLDPGVVARRVEALPWVAKAQVVRNWREGRVTIEVLERVPVAVVDHGDAFSVLDVGGKVLAVTSGDPSAELPRITGVAPVPVGDTLTEALPAVTVVAGASDALAGHLDSVRMVAGAPELVLDPQGVVRLCDVTQLEVKLRTVATVLAEVDLTDLATIDVCVPDTAVLTREGT